MNHLAHLLLAGEDPDEIAGALMGDFVRGRIQDQFTAGIRLGMLMHRKIDTFTDAHPVTLDSRRRIRPQLRRYAGLVVDLAYDYYLARHWARFSNEDFDGFADRIYTALWSRHGQMPEPLRERLPRMIEDDFLRRGLRLDDLARALARLQSRLSRAPDLAPAVDDVAAADAGIQADFLVFFPQLTAYAQRQRQELIRH